MRERIRDKERLEHILKSINVLLEYKDKYSYEIVSSDPIVFYGFVKHVEIIGEAFIDITLWIIIALANLQIVELSAYSLIPVYIR